MFADMWRSRWGGVCQLPSKWVATTERRWLQNARKQYDILFLGTSKCCKSNCLIKFNLYLSSTPYGFPMQSIAFPLLWEGFMSVVQFYKPCSRSLTISHCTSWYEKIGPAFFTSLTIRCLGDSKRLKRWVQSITISIYIYIHRHTIHTTPYHTITLHYIALHHIASHYIHYITLIAYINYIHSLHTFIALH